MNDKDTKLEDNKEVIDEVKNVTTDVAVSTIDKHEDHMRQEKESHLLLEYG